LFSNEANKDVANKIPAISAVTKTPIGILSAIAGLSTEARLSDVLGISLHEFLRQGNLYSAMLIFFKWGGVS